MKAQVLIPVLALMTTFGSISAIAQQGGGRGNFDPEEFRARQAERMKETLQVNDEEWAAIAPLVEEVQTLQRSALAGQRGFRGRRGGGGGGFGGFEPPPEVAALQTALESESTSTEEIKAKLEALREAREKNAAELAEAREKLRSVLTARQEAALVLVSLLD